MKTNFEFITENNLTYLIAKKADYAVRVELPENLANIRDINASELKFVIAGLTNKLTEGDTNV